MPTGLREQTLVDADVLLSWNLPKELPPAGPGQLRRTKMIQLLSAGADHLPFPELRSDIVIASNVGAYADPMAEHVLAMALALAEEPAAAAPKPDPRRVPSVCPESYANRFGVRDHRVRRHRPG